MNVNPMSALNPNTTTATFSKPDGPHNFTTELASRFIKSDAFETTAVNTFGHTIHIHPIPPAFECKLFKLQVLWIILIIRPYLDLQFLDNHNQNVVFLFFMTL